MFKIKNKQRGFTLTEMAIVLGIIGLILGAIWYAASSVYLNWKVSNIMQEVVVFENNARVQYHGMSVATSNSENNSDDDTCGSALPCGTANFVASQTFEDDFIPGNLVSGATYGLPLLYASKYGFPIWTGIENGDLYKQQDGQCGNSPLPPCTSNMTVVELDLLDIPADVCSRLMFSLANAHIDGIVDIAGPSGGFGSVEGGTYYGNDTIPDNMTLQQAEAACAPSSDDAYSYISTQKSYIWIFINLN